MTFEEAKAGVLSACRNTFGDSLVDVVVREQGDTTIVEVSFMKTPDQPSSMTITLTPQTKNDRMTV